MEPIDNADKKTFWQWLAGKGPLYVAVDIFITIMYIMSMSGGIGGILLKRMAVMDSIILLILANGFFIGNLLKTLQNYHDDQKGITR